MSSQPKGTKTRSARRKTSSAGSAKKKTNDSSGAQSRIPPAASPAGTPSPATNLPHGDLSVTVTQETTTNSKPHAFVVMPFGKKSNGEGELIDFDAIYEQLIKPALKQAGFECFRADDETQSGDILTDMFQELLLADLVLADMSIDNSNVFYELGVRHAFRKSGVVHIQAGRTQMPFDVFNVRTVTYHTNDNGEPDTQYITKDRKAIVRAAQDTFGADQDAVHSPIFRLLTGLVEPDRQMLQTPLAKGFWREYGVWKGRVNVAEAQRYVGDILLLTEEISNPLIKEAALGEAGRALEAMGLQTLALQQYRRGLELNPHNLVFRREEACTLGKIGRVDEAIIKADRILKHHPNDAQTRADLAHIYQTMWVNAWSSIDDDDTRLHEAFSSHHWLVKSFYTHLRAYRADVDRPRPGVNALTLATILEQLSTQFDRDDDPDPYIRAVLNTIPELRGALIFTTVTERVDWNRDYECLISLAEMALSTANEPHEVAREYRRALTAANKSIVLLEDARYQLCILKSLRVREAFVEAAMQVIDDELRRIRNEAEMPIPEPMATNGVTRRIGRASESRFRRIRPTTLPAKATGPKPITPIQAILFGGHMIDPPDAVSSRLPSTEQAELDLRHEIDRVLNKVNADGNDIGFTTGASAGSEIIFIEACLARGMSVRIHLPCDAAQYVERFVSWAGEEWSDRFYVIYEHEGVSVRVQAEAVGEPPPGMDVHSRNNRWAVYSSLGFGLDKMRALAFWDGKAGISQDADGKRVADLVYQTRQQGARVEIVDVAQSARRRRSTSFERVQDDAVIEAD